MEGLAIIGFFTAIAGFVACGAWRRAGRALANHGALDSRFKENFSEATVVTSIFLFLGSVLILMGVFVLLP